MSSLAPAVLRDDGEDWKLVAFVGRYGHTPAQVCAEMTRAELYGLANAIAELLREEGTAGLPRPDGTG